MNERSRLVRMTIKNIGCIGNDGLSVELDEIVCLVGANNSGKTTVLRAYEMAIQQLPLKADDLNTSTADEPASVELWVHIPKAAANVDEKWKEEKDGLLLVRSKWEWPAAGGKPVRTTWDPAAQSYAEDGKASGLDTVFNSRLPQPFRIGSLQDPAEEHRKLLTLVLEPVTNKLKALMQDETSELRQKVEQLQDEAEKPVAEFKEQLDRVQARVNTSYRQVFNSAEIKLTVKLGDIGFDPQKSLTNASRIDVSEKHGQTRWDQQGTGSQRALFWSMLQVRSELNQLAGERKQIEKDKADLAKLETKQKKTKADDEKIASLKQKLTSPSPASQDNGGGPFLPGYMLLIDEPETALHPSAVRAAKDHLYALAAEPGWQVMLSTHHPAFIDPIKDHTTIVRLHRPEAHLPPNVYRSRNVKFDGDELENLKALLAFDTHVSEIFFGGHVLLVEGDTEFAAFSEVMNLDPVRYPAERRPLIVRARGKATIRTLVKILTQFRIDFSVLHDIDAPRTHDGKKANPAFALNTAIAASVDTARTQGCRVTYRCSCPNFEMHHGMALLEKDKPYESWRAVRNVESVRESVRAVLDSLWRPPTDHGGDTPEDGKNSEPILKEWVRKNAVHEPRFKFDHA